MDLPNYKKSKQIADNVNSKHIVLLKNWIFTIFREIQIVAPACQGSVNFFSKYTTLDVSLKQRI